MFPRLHESWVASIPLRRLERGVSEGGWRIGESGDRERERKCKKGIVRVSEVACPRAAVVNGIVACNSNNNKNNRNINDYNDLGPRKSGPL